jgi:hypothetical protein
MWPMGLLFLNIKEKNIWHVMRNIVLNFVELEDVQIEILKVLLTHSDPVEVRSLMSDYDCVHRGIYHEN